jgi:hypothetical protein
MQQVQRPATPAVARADDGTLRLYSGGYGFGLGVSSNCDFALFVGHSGGLPGFGSVMRWLPEYGVGIIAFGNRTYTSWGPPTGGALALMSQTGALQQRMPQPSPMLVARKEAVSRLVMHWSDALADSIAAVNLFLDQSRDRRRAHVDSVLAKVGPCRAATGFDLVENALRGQWTLPCEHGFARIYITLAPTMPPTVQLMTVDALTEPEPPRRPGLCPGSAGS